MSDKHESLLLLDDDQLWAERFVNALQVRGWNISWSDKVESFYGNQLYSVYLVNLSLLGLDPKAMCDHIRGMPKGENASIFLLNDGQAPLKSFEEALTIGADGLYFHKTQMPLLLANFPPKVTGANRTSNRGDYLTLSSRHFGAGITLGGIERDHEESSASKHSGQDRKLYTDGPQQMSHQDHVVGMSLGYRNRQRLSQGYSIDKGLSVSDIEAALADVDMQSNMGKQSTPMPIEKVAQELRKPDDSPQGLPLATDSSPFSHTSTHIPSSNVPSLTPMMTLAGVQTKPYGGQTASKELQKPTPYLPWGDEIRLATCPFAQCLAYIISHRLSLNLLIENEKFDEENSTQCLLVISEGEIVHIRSSDLHISLMNQLISNAVLTQRDAEQALNTITHQGDLETIDIVIEAIIELSPTAVGQLDDAMEQALLKTIYRLFELSSGRVHIETYQRPPDIRRFQLSSTRILLNGIRESMGKLKLYKVFGTPREIPFVASSKLFLGELTAAERSLIQGAQGHRTITELSDDSGLSVFDSLSLCYAFHLFGELVLNKESPLRHFFERSYTEDYYQLLSLNYDADTQEITEAWRSHRQWLSEQRGDQELVTPLIDIMNDAYCVLAHPPLRVRYLNSLSKPLYSDRSIIPESYVPTSSTKRP